MKRQNIVWKSLMLSSKYRNKKIEALLSLLITGLLLKSGGLLLSRIALQYHRRKRA